MHVDTGEHRTSSEVAVEELDIEGSTHQDHLQQLETRKQLTQNYQQEVTESVSLVDLILAAVTNQHNVPAVDYR